MKANEMKKRVFEVGNRLSADMSRTAAFGKAWALVKAQAVTVSVRGVTFGSRQIALRRLARYPAQQVRAFLMPEPENTYDPDAIAVMVGVNGGRGYYKLGYVPASEAKAVNALGRRIVNVAVKQGTTCGAAVTVRV
jgi:hypothetical protein